MYVHVFSRAREAGTTPFQVTSVSQQTQSFTQAAAEPRGLTEPGGPGQTGKAAFLLLLFFSVEPWTPWRSLGKLSKEQDWIQERPLVVAFLFIFIQWPCVPDWPLTSLHLHYTA